MTTRNVKELLLQSLVHERGGVLVYQTALECVLSPKLREEWQDYLQQTRHHVQVLTRTCQQLGLDPGEMTPGCQVVQHLGKALVVAMKMALAANDPPAAELVACEAVVLAETKDHFDWELIGECAKAGEGQASTILQAAYDEVEDEEDEHLYRTKEWCRELWLKSLGVKPRRAEERRGIAAATAG